MDYNTTKCCIRCNKLIDTWCMECQDCLKEKIFQADERLREMHRLYHYNKTYGKEKAST